MPIKLASAHLPATAGLSLPVATGVHCYVTILAVMLCLVVSQVRANYRPVVPAVGAPTNTQPVMLSIPTLELATDSCIRVTESGWQNCDRAAQREATRASARRHRERNLRLAKIGASNLLWAPPGAVLEVQNETPQLLVPPAYRIVEASNLSSANPVPPTSPAARVSSLMASR